MGTFLAASCGISRAKMNWIVSATTHTQTNHVANHAMRTFSRVKSRVEYLSYRVYVSRSFILLLLLITHYIYLTISFRYHHMTQLPRLHIARAQFVWMCVRCPPKGSPHTLNRRAFPRAVPCVCARRPPWPFCGQWPILWVPPGGTCSFRYVRACNKGCASEG